MPVFALITHISCCLNWLIVYLMGNLVPKSCNWQLWVFWRVLVASSRTSYCYRSLHQQVGAFLVTFYCTALKKQLYTCEQAYNLVFLRVQQKFDLLELCQSQKRAQFVPECPKHCRWVPPSHFLSGFCEILKLGRNHGCVWLLQAVHWGCTQTTQTHSKNASSVRMGTYLSRLPGSLPWTLCKWFCEIFSPKPPRPQFLSDLTENWERRCQNHALQGCNPC